MDEMICLTVTFLNYMVGTRERDSINEVWTSDQLF